MKWYAARMLFVSLIEGVPPEDPLLEERIVLFRSTSEDDARADARRYGLREAHEYENEQGQNVAWILRAVTDVALVEDAEPGKPWEVMSRFLREREVVEPDEA